MRKFTVKQYAMIINKMADEGLLWYIAGTIKESRDLWRSPANMALLNEDARIAAKHYIKENS